LKSIGSKGPAPRRVQAEPLAFSKDSTRAWVCVYCSYYVTPSLFPPKPGSKRLLGAKSRTQSPRHRRHRPFYGSVSPDSSRNHIGGSAERIIALGIETIDQVLPTAGFRLGALHEAASAGPDHGTTPPPPRFHSPASWRVWMVPILVGAAPADLFAPAWPPPGWIPPGGVRRSRQRTVLPVMEEGLRHSGLAAVVAEHTGRLSLVASARLQLGAEQAGILAILIRRSPASTTRC